MKKLISLLIAVGISLGLAASTLAQEAAPAPGTKTPHINKRQRRQQRRIGRGVSSGQLTPGETRRLEAEEAKIQKDKLAAKSDGAVTRQERAQLHKEENKASRDIRRLKHNRRRMHR